jgi:ribosomal protein S18 acetylase RimI-like enzyme
VPARHPLPVTRLRAEDRCRAADVLGQAFTEDPLWAAIMPDEATRPTKLTRMFSDLTKLVAGARGLPLTAGTLSVALWMPPGRDLGLRAFLRSGFSTVRTTLALPADDRRRMLGALRQIGRKRGRHVPDPHWYLLALGTDPDHQGEGLGSTLVREGTRRADEAGARTYLETETEANVDFYSHLGFEVVEEMTIEDLDVPIWLMRREPSRST